MSPTKGRHVRELSAHSHRTTANASGQLHAHLQRGGGEALTSIIQNGDDGLIERLWNEVCSTEKHWHDDLVSIRQYVDDTVEVETDSPGHADFTADYVGNVFGIGEILPTLSGLGLEELLRIADSLNGEPRLAAFKLLQEVLPAK